jgi:hypothetical protein
MMRIGETEQIFACNCAFRTTDAEELTVHCLRASLPDGKGTHRSIGVVDPNTGKVIVPPRLVPLVSMLPMLSMLSCCLLS